MYTQYYKTTREWDRVKEERFLACLWDPSSLDERKEVVRVSRASALASCE